GGLAAGTAAQRLAVDGQGVPAVGGPAAQPLAQGRLDGGQVQAAEELAERALGGGLAAAEAEGVGQGGAVVAAELGDGLQAAVAGEDGDDAEGEDGRQGMAAAAQLARVGDGSEDIHQTRDHNRHPPGSGDDRTPDTYPKRPDQQTSTWKQPCWRAFPSWRQVS